jgi:hypothetical protein
MADCARLERRGVSTPAARRPEGRDQRRTRVETPDELTIRVIEEDAGEVILALPPTASPEALRDEELASAAGGDVWGAQTVETCQLSPCGVQKTNPGCCEGR